MPGRQIVDNHDPQHQVNKYGDLGNHCNRWK